MDVRRDDGVEGTRTYFSSKILSNRSSKRTELRNRRRDHIIVNPNISLSCRLDKPVSAIGSYRRNFDSDKLHRKHLRLAWSAVHRNGDRGFQVTRVGMDSPPRRYHRTERRYIHNTNHLYRREGIDPSPVVQSKSSQRALFVPNETPSPSETENRGDDSSERDRLRSELKHARNTLQQLRRDCSEKKNELETLRSRNRSLQLGRSEDAERKVAMERELRRSMDEVTVIRCKLEETERMAEKSRMQHLVSNRTAKLMNEKMRELRHEYDELLKKKSQRFVNTRRRG